jgi:hypothetical protein
MPVREKLREMEEERNHLQESLNYFRYKQSTQWIINAPYVQCAPLTLWGYRMSVGPK